MPDSQKKSRAMKKLIITAILCLSALFSAKGQTVFTCEYRTEADVKVYVTNYRNEADLVVYKCDYRNEASGNRGLWYFVEYRTEAKKKIYFVNYRNEADLVIYFTHYRNEAGWRNEKKEHLMEEQ